MSVYARSRELVITGDGGVTQGNPVSRCRWRAWGGWNLESQMCRVNRTGGAHRLNRRLTVIVGDDVADPHGQIGLLGRTPVSGAAALKRLITADAAPNDCCWSAKVSAVWLYLTQATLFISGCRSWVPLTGRFALAKLTDEVKNRLTREMFCRAS